MKTKREWRGGLATMVKRDVLRVGAAGLMALLLGLFTAGACGGVVPDGAGGAAAATAGSGGTGPAGENTADKCADGIDNDGDGKVDCADPECIVAFGDSLCKGGATAASGTGGTAGTGGGDDDYFEPGSAEGQDTGGGTDITLNPGVCLGLPLDLYKITGYHHGSSVGGGKLHAGDDLYAPAPTPVYSIWDGKVRWAAKAGTWGYLVEIDHVAPDGTSFISLYGHLGADLMVVAGQQVSKGQVVGLTGKTSVNGGWPEHLHFSIYTGVPPATGVLKGHVSSLAGYENPIPWMNAHGVGPGCGTVCGNFNCEAGENCGSCPQDCQCPAQHSCKNNACVPDIPCGNNVCDNGENCGSCPQDCKCQAGQICQGNACVVSDPCGDNTCGNGENCGTCPQDCKCPAQHSCKNNACVPDISCGDNICNAGENCGSCPQDCKCQAGQSCQGNACVACGANNQPCCSNNTCNAPLMCTGGVCGCTPSCANKCGGAADGCGGTCNDPCASGCCQNMACVSGTSDAACGNSGLACSACNFPKKCSGGACVCSPNCAGKCGGPDGCGGTCAPGTLDSACGNNGPCSVCSGGQSCVGGSCSCGAPSYWSPNSGTDSEATGWQDVNKTRTPVMVATIAVTVKQANAGSGLQFQVCKVGSTFNQDIHVDIHDTSGPMVAWYSGNLSTAGQPCSPWTNLQNSTGFSTGQVFNGKWQVQSPFNAVGWTAQCAMADPATGTCWYGPYLGSAVSLTRTCKP